MKIVKIRFNPQRYWAWWDYFSMLSFSQDTRTHCLRLGLLKVGFYVEWETNLNHQKGAGSL